MFVKADPKQEEERLENLITTDEAAQQAHELFLAEMEFKEKLLQIRKAESLTQKDIAKKAGLSQQAISRIERVQGTTLETIIRYLSSMGYVLGIERA